MSAVCAKIEGHKRGVLTDTLNANRRFERKMCHLRKPDLQELSDDSDDNTDDSE